MSSKRRVGVTYRCERPCPSCILCRADGVPATLDEVLAHGDADSIILGGGDATAWAPLDDFLKANREREKPQEIWVEAPARALDSTTLDRLQQGGVKGVRVQIEGFGKEMCQALGVGDPEAVVSDLRARGMDFDVRLCVRPKTFGIIGPVANLVRPEAVWLEISRTNWSGPPLRMKPEAVDKVLNEHVNVAFSTYRDRDIGYLPPCTLPKVFEHNPAVWRAALGPRSEPNDVLPTCATCALNRQCHWKDPEALSPESIAALVPIRNAMPEHTAVYLPVPPAIVKKRTGKPVICTEPWTTMEIADPSGNIHQCGGNWTDLLCGNIHQGSLARTWNGTQYQKARRMMAERELKGLCSPICVHLHDQRLGEDRFKIRDGAKAFVDNQLLALEDIAERREVVRARPLHLTLSPSSYCNYNCLFCDHGRSARRDMPEAVWDELHELLPTLKTLTVLGGEPFANQKVQEFLVDFDIERAPDVRLDFFTNGSLLTEKYLTRIKRAPIGEITVSLNSGTADVYEKIERPKHGGGFEVVLENIDALVRLRARYPFWFGITLSLIVQRDNAHTLLAFGEIARSRNLHIRLVGLNVQGWESLNFYKNPDDVAMVMGHLDAFGAWAQKVRPDWMHQVQGARGAILGEAQRRQNTPGQVQHHPVNRGPLLPIIS